MHKTVVLRVEELALLGGFVALVVQEQETRPARGDERVHQQVVEPVHQLEVHGVRLPLALVHEIKRRVHHELMQMRGVVFFAAGRAPRGLRAGRAKVALVLRHVLLRDDHERRETHHRAVGRARPPRRRE